MGLEGWDKVGERDEGKDADLEDRGLQGRDEEGSRCTGGKALRGGCLEGKDGCGDGGEGAEGFCGMGYRENVGGASGWTVMDGR